MTPRVARLRVYPIKSLDGVDVATAELTARGGLRHDRAYALVDAAGRYVNGKIEPRLHALRTRYDDAFRAVTLTDAGGASRTFDLGGPTSELAAWIGERIGRTVSVRHDENGGFPDDERAPGPTLVSTATLAAVAAWFDGVDADAMRERLRTNIEIDGVPAFWEDRLFGPAGEVIPFRVGAVELEGTNPCQRCIVPSRDPRTGEAIPAFSKRVAERRAATLPPWAERSRFDHFYRLALNTRAAAGQRATTISVGDAIACDDVRAVQTSRNGG